MLDFNGYVGWLQFSVLVTPLLAAKVAVLKMNQDSSLFLGTQLHYVYNAHFCWIFKTGEHMSWPVPAHS